MRYRSETRRSAARLKVVTALTLLAGVLTPAGAMVYKPASGARIWDPSVIYHDGMYYAFSMYGTSGKAMTNVGLAISENGVHWKDHGPVITDDITVFKPFVAKVGDTFFLNHGSFTGHGKQRKQNRLCYFSSENLVDWTFLYADQPDPQYYDPERRWDHMYVLPKDENDPSAGYWGYVVAKPAAGKGLFGGMQESDDGLHWRQLPPPEVDWKSFPPPEAEWKGFDLPLLELGGVERIDGRFYMLGGRPDPSRGFENYGVYTLVADDPRGPFRPDWEAFRLCGTTGYEESGVTSLAAFARGRDGEILVSNYLRAGAVVWMLPLRKAVVDGEGHLRLGYWPGNEAAKGERLPLASEDFVHWGGVKPTDVPSGILKVSTGLPKKRAKFENEIALALGGEELDLERGVIAEARLRVGVLPWKRRIPAAGFLIEEASGTGKAALLEVGHPWRRRTMVGDLDFRDLLESGSSASFNPIDVVRQGEATVRGIGRDEEVTLRLWIRQGMFEFYVDDRLARVGIYDPAAATGRIGFVVQNAELTVRALRVWQMNFESENLYPE